MNKSGLASNTVFRDIIESLVVSYGERNTDIDFFHWLSDKLRQEIADLSIEASENLAEKIIAGIADYDNTLDDLNRAVEGGQAEEEWLSERLSKEYADLPLDVAGERIQNFDESITQTDMELMENIDETECKKADVFKVETAGWNKYSIKNRIHEIGQKASLLGIAAAANAIKSSTQNALSQESTTVISDAIQNNKKSEVKAVLATATKVAAEKHITDTVPPDISIEEACDVAGMTIEGAEALLDAANGKIPIKEALRKIGKAGIAAGCRLCSGVLKGVFQCCPFGGLLNEMLSNALRHMESRSFTEKVYTTVRNAAVSIWQGIKNIGKKIFSGLKKLLFN